MRQQLLGALSLLDGERIRHRRGHPLRVTSGDFGNYRLATCDRCGEEFQQHLVWSAPTGPWRSNARVPCTHGTAGVAVPACMQCAITREKRGLR